MPRGCCVCLMCVLMCVIVMGTEHAGTQQDTLMCMLDSNQFLTSFTALTTVSFTLAQITMTELEKETVCVCVCGGTGANFNG